MIIRFFSVWRFLSAFIFLLSTFLFIRSIEKNFSGHSSFRLIFTLINSRAAQNSRAAEVLSRSQ